MSGYQRWVSETDRDDKLVFPEDERLVDQEYLRYKYVLNTYLTSTCSTGMYCCVTTYFQSKSNNLFTDKY
jgi:hypothetical protein